MRLFGKLGRKHEHYEVSLGAMKENLLAMENSILRLERNCDVVMERNRNVVLRAIPKLFVVEGPQKARGMH